jgi:hypothetical protein
MPDDTKKGRPLSGEVLPPARSETHLPIEPPLRGIPLFNRMRYNAARKELEAYLSVLRLRNAVIGEITTTIELRERYDTGLVRFDRIDDLRRIENLKIDAELNQALSAAVRASRSGAINDLLHRARLADAEAMAIEAEQALHALKNPPPPSGPPPPQPSESERIAAKIAELRRREKELIAALVGEYENEDDLSEEDLELIRDVRLKTRDLIAKLMDELD